MSGREYWFRLGVSVVLAYESVALQVGGLPTVTALCHRRPVLAGLVCGWLTVHFVPPMKDSVSSFETF